MRTAVQRCADGGSAQVCSRSPCGHLQADEARRQDVFRVLQQVGNGIALAPAERGSLVKAEIKVLFSLLFLKLGWREGHALLRWV